MASSPPSSQYDELCRYILDPNPEELAEGSVRRQVSGETVTAEAVDWLEDDEPLVIEFPDPELDTGKRKNKSCSGRLPMLTATGSSLLQGPLFVGREMAPPAFLISSRGGPAGEPHSGTKRRLSSGSSDSSRPKFKMIRKAPVAHKALPTLSSEDVNSQLPPSTEPFATGPTPANSSDPNTRASPSPCPPLSFHPSPCPPTSQGVLWRPQAMSPDSSGHRNVRVVVLAPEREERLSSACKVEGNSVFVKPQSWFRLQIESSDPANTVVRVSAHYMRDEACQTPLVACDKGYDTHKRACRVCNSRTSGDRPFLCSNNAKFPIHPLAHVAAGEDEASFTPLDSFVSSADPNKVTLQMTALCLTSCAHHKKRKVALLVEARQRDDATTVPHLDTFSFAIRCCQSPTRDSKPKFFKSDCRTPSNNPAMSPASFIPSPPQYLPGLCPDAPPSACLSPSPDLLNDDPMFSSATSPPFSPSREIRHEEFDGATILQDPLKEEPCSSLLRTNDHHQLVPGTDKPIFHRLPSVSKCSYILEVRAGDLDTLERNREKLHRLNFEVSPGYKIQMS